MNQYVADRVVELGLAETVTLAGYVPFGEQLLALYRASDMLLHVSLYRGRTQVLVEAFATGFPLSRRTWGASRRQSGAATQPCWSNQGRSTNWSQLVESLSAIRASAAGWRRQVYGARVS